MAEQADQHDHAAVQPERRRGVPCLSKLLIWRHNSEGVALHTSRSLSMQRRLAAAFVGYILPLRASNIY